MLLNFYCCFVLFLVVKFRQIKLKKVSVLIFFIGFAPAVTSLFLDYLVKRHENSEAWQRLLHETDREDLAEICCAVGWNKG